MYNKAIDKQNSLQDERQNYIINILKTTRLVQPKDKNVREMIHNAVKLEPYHSIFLIYQKEIRINWK